ncbi:MAG TPA: family 78 glycoside hydrolase catalytic domain, partial [Acidimicrobiales bacterium]|nr:family 78 glycoside hydrolase catalytic domain [Acidimicrobiales bacterium]
MNSEQQGWRPVRLRCDRLTDPLGTGSSHPVYSWRLPPEGPGRQQAYRLVAGAPAAAGAGAAEDGVATGAGGPGGDGEEAPVGGELWDSGWVESPATSTRHAGRAVASRELWCWSVSVRAESGETSAWSNPARFEAGLLHRGDWHAAFVGRPAGAAGAGSRAPYHVRRMFRLDEVPLHARAYVTALGVYELWVNGGRAGDGLLRPGWTDHRRRVPYQVIDLSSLLRQGDNVVAATLAPGWYAGRIASRVDADSGRAVPIPQLLAQLEILAGERRHLVVTDESWEWRPSAATSSDLYDGEDWDLRRLPGGFSHIEDCERWSPVERTDGTAGLLVAQACEPVRQLATATASVTWRDGSRAVIDSGRNDSGFARLRVATDAGRRIEVSYSEILDPAGNLYRDNLRAARCTDSFVSAGSPAEELQPSFSFRGWRYAEVSGLAGREQLLGADAVTIGTDLERTGWFSCSEPLLERLHEMMACSLQANYVEVPTDCPQRDERMGWTADALLFAPVASYTYDVQAFLAKWLDDVLDARTPKGGFTDIAPRPSATWPGRSFEAGAPAWADAGVHVPWLLYERYGDVEVLERMYPAMRDWLELVHGENPGGLWRAGRGNDYGDWVPAGPDTSHELFATCWLYHSTTVAARVAGVLG